MRVIGFLLVCATLLGAQDEAATEDEAAEVPKRSVRLLAVGNAPPFRQEIRDGVRYELPPPPGSLPPRSLMLERKTEDEPEELGELRVQLGRLSGAVEFREGATTLQLRDKEGELWATLACPEQGDFLVLLWRDPAVGKWTKPKMKIVPDERKPETVRFLNVSRAAVAIVVGENRKALRPLQQWQAPLVDGDPVSFQLGLIRRDGAIKREVSLALEQSKNESTLVVMSDADGQEVRRPLKITRLRERVR